MTKHKSRSNYQRSIAVSEEGRGGLFGKIESMPEEAVKELYELLSIKENLNPKEKIELFWLTVKVMDLDEQEQEDLFYDILDLDENFAEEYEG